MAAPEVKAITDAAVDLIGALGGIVRLHLACLAGPEFRNDLLALIFAAVAHAVDNTGELLCGDKQTPAAGLEAVRVSLPERIFADAEWLEQTRRKIFAHGLAGNAVDYGAEDIAVFAYVLPSLARGERPTRVKKALEPRNLRLVVKDADILAGSHRQQMENRHLLKVRVIFFRPVFRENINDLSVERQQSLINSEARRYRGKALAHGIHCVRNVRPVRVAPGLKGDLAVAQDHEAVKLDIAFLKIRKQLGYGL